MTPEELRIQYQIERDEPAIHNEPVVELDYVCWLEKRIIELELKLQQNELDNIIDSMQKYEKQKELCEQMKPIIGKYIIKKPRYFSSFC